MKELIFITVSCKQLSPARVGLQDHRFGVSQDQSPARINSERIKKRENETKQQKHHIWSDHHAGKPSSWITHRRVQIPFIVTFLMKHKNEILFHV